MPGKMDLSLTPFATLSPSALPRDQVEAPHVHVPFCFHKCHYCDFYSITRQTPDRMERFVDLVLAESEQWTSVRPVDSLRPRTIFFGGGTPSLLPFDAMRRLLIGLRDRFDLSRVEEWTIEVNPATANEDYCRMLSEFGVNRLSFGGKASEPMSWHARTPSPSPCCRSIELARRAGFSRLNVDLIYAVPGQKLASWSYSLENALTLGTEHLSCYGLTYEPNTPMGVKHRLGTIKAVEDSIELEMLHHTRRRLIDAGLPPYEISNYPRTGAECQHNLVYWTGGNYIGLGPSAASHLSGWRWRNHRIRANGSKRSPRKPCPGPTSNISPRFSAGEPATPMLRLSRGIEFEEFNSRTGCSARELFSDPIGRLTAPRTDNDRCRRNPPDRSWTECRGRNFRRIPGPTGRRPNRELDPPIHLIRCFLTVDRDHGRGPACDGVCLSAGGTALPFDRS